MFKNCIYALGLVITVLTTVFSPTNAYAWICAQSVTIDGISFSGNCMTVEYISTVPVSGTTYYVDYKLSSATTWQSSPSGSNGIITVCGLNYGATYNVRVRATCSYGNTYSTTSTVTVPNAPTCPLVTGLAVTTPNPYQINPVTLSWTAISGYTSYTVTLYDIDTMGIGTYTANTNNLNVSLTSGSYYFSVKPNNCTGGTTPTLYGFSVGGCDVIDAGNTAATARLLSVNTGSSVTLTGCLSSTADQDWYQLNTNGATVTLTGPAGVNYKVSLYYKASLIATQISTNGSPVTITGSCQPTPYYRIKIFTTQTTVSSNVYTLTASVPACKMAIESSPAPTLSLYPNPTRNHATLQYNTNTDETATVTLLDLSGKTVAINNEYATAGSNEFGIDTNQLPAGIYLVRLQTPTQSFTERLVIAR